MTVGAGVALLAAVAAIIAAALGYLARVRLPRPPIGVYRWSDIVVMVAVVVLAPAGYAALPVAAPAALFGLALTAAARLALTPLLGPRRATAAAAAAAAADLAFWALPAEPALRVVNGLLIGCALVGVTNLWVQTSMRAAHVAVLAAILTGYDIWSTWFSSTTNDLMTRLETRPFAPILAITGGHVPATIGLGDCMMLTLWPLVAARCFGRREAGVGAIIGLLAVLAVVVAFASGAVRSAVPLLALLGPAIVVQYLGWRLTGRTERTVGRWRTGAPAAGGDVSPLGAALRTAVAVVGDRPEPSDDGAESGRDLGWLAVIDQQIVGRGSTPGSARRAARQAGHTAVPTVLHSLPDEHGLST